ncbi:Hypothetical predicted protein [Pelobates cultripes]|uniref:Uncharacterized protein n=1 Tax=Pelobates cultripes TaxID=61616 RepID=A0AAD1T5Z6_PELCU|nr:Hypothetical predicted protein [Pelobates cultripes]
MAALVEAPQPQTSMAVQTWQEIFYNKFNKICQEFCPQHPLCYAVLENLIAATTPPSTSRQKFLLKPCQANHPAAQRGSRNTPRPGSRHTPERRQRHWRTPQLMHNRSSRGPMQIRSYRTLIDTCCQRAPAWSSMKGRLLKHKLHNQRVPPRLGLPSALGWFQRLDPVASYCWTHKDTQQGHSHIWGWWGPPPQLDICRLTVYFPTLGVG